jgi:hypothetical protein
MSINGPPDCQLCERPIVKGMEVLLNKEPFHPGCAVVVVKERKHGHKTHDARRSAEGNKAGVISCADPAGN